MNTEVVIVLISSALGFLTGGIPAYLTYRATNKRLDSEAEERKSKVDVNLTEATQRIVDSAADQLTSMTAVMEQKIAAVEKTAELALKEAKMVKSDLDRAQKEITRLTRLVCELYDIAKKLIEQLIKENIEPEVVLPDVGEEIEKLIEQNGWH